VLESHPQAAGYKGTLRAELAAITARYEAADHRAKRAETIEDRDQAEEEKREAAGDFWAAEADLADLLLMLLRLAIRHQPAALGQYLYRAVELQLLEVADQYAREQRSQAKAIVSLEARVARLEKRS